MENWNTMTSFQYVDFYDYPRCIALNHRGKLVLLLSAFDDDRDEYPNEYTVYLLPPVVSAQLKAGSWKFLEEVPLNPIGQIPLERVKFDSTKRKKLDASILDDLIG
jgi:hypothetical protein